MSGLLALLLFSMFNNFLGGVFMALMDPYGLTLMSVEAWGGLIAFTSLGFIVGGLIVTRRGLGANPVRSLLLANVVMWTVTIVFPIRSEILPLAIGFFVYLDPRPDRGGVRADGHPAGRAVQGAGPRVRLRPDPRGRRGARSRRS